MQKKYIDVIVEELERVKSGALDGYYFGRDRYGIDCDLNSCVVTDNLSDEQLKKIPFDDIYNLMKSWKKYYEEWERNAPPDLLK